MLIFPDVFVFLKIQILLLSRSLKYNKLMRFSSFFLTLTTIVDYDQHFFIIQRSIFGFGFSGYFYCVNKFANRVSLGNRSWLYSSSLGTKTIMYRIFGVLQSCENFEISSRAPGRRYDPSRVSC
jgi:hypothetical protein